MSGLISLVDGVWKSKAGGGDELLQSFNYRLCLTTNCSNSLPFTPPTSYNSSLYLLYTHFIQAANLTAIDPMFNMGQHNLARRYIEAQWEERRRIAQEYREFTDVLLYFLSHDLSLPLEVPNAVTVEQWEHLHIISIYYNGAEESRTNKQQVTASDDHVAPNVNVLFPRPQEEMAIGFRSEINKSDGGE